MTRVSVVTHPHGGHVIGVFETERAMNRWIDASDWDHSDVATHPGRMVRGGPEQ